MRVFSSAATLAILTLESAVAGIGNRTGSTG
jgi:hypothetical protein